MIERPGLFTAYSSVLRSLVLLPQRGVPFEKELVYTKCSNIQPSYIQFLPLTDFNAIKTKVLGQVVLDDSQAAAVELALSQRVALIQGPPGTGKTFCGLRIVAMVLQMKRASDKLKQTVKKGEMQKDDATSYTDLHRHYTARDKVPSAMDGPILVLTYKNHALDQFLTGCLKTTDNIVRVGSRSKSLVMEGYNLKNVSKKVTAKAQMSGRHFASRRVEDAKKSLVLCVKLLQEASPEFDGKELSPALRAEFTLDVFQKYASSWQQEFFQKCSPVQDTIERLLEVWIPKTPTYLEPEKKDSRPVAFAAAPIKTHNHKRSSEFKEVAVSPGEALSKLVMTNYRPLHRIQENKGPDQPDKDENDELEEAKSGIVQAKITDVMPLSVLPCYHFIEGRVLNELFIDDDLWSMRVAERNRLARHWLWQALEAKRQELDRENQEANQDFSQLRDDMYLNVMRSSDIVGMTTTGAALHHELVAALKPSIVIVEEAAEIMESQLIACLHTSTQHLILIGDHKQLQPTIQCFQLELFKNLHISLFERLINNGFPVQTLGFQRRMHPTISRCVGSIYPHLYNHATLCVRKFSMTETAPISVIPFGKELVPTKVTEPNARDHDPCEIHGMARNMVFWSHQHMELTSESGFSVTNPKEVEMIVFIAHCLLAQRIAPQRITVLTTYKGQLQLLRKALKNLAENMALPLREAGQLVDMPSIQALTVDMYQGDENDIILLSLVRSNEEGKIGFLSRANRYCVALSRARHGLYVCGNLNMLAEKNQYWEGLADQLRRSGSVYENFPLQCPRHPGSTINISNDHPKLSSFTFASSIPWNNYHTSDPRICLHETNQLAAQSPTKRRESHVSAAGAADGNKVTPPKRRESSAFTAISPQAAGNSQDSNDIADRSQEAESSVSP